jgi:hypothetical protein
MVSWSAWVVRGSGRAARSSMPRATAWVMSSSHSRSLGAAWAGGGSPVEGGGSWPREAVPLEQAAEHAATTSHANRMLPRW